MAIESLDDSYIEYLSTGRLTRVFPLGGKFFFTFQSLTSRESKRLDNYSGNSHLHLQLLLEKSLTHINEQQIEVNDIQELVDSAEPILLEWFQICYFDLLIELRSLEHHFRKFLFSPRSAFLYESFREHFLTHSPFDLSPLQREWLIYNRAEHNRRKTTEHRRDLFYQISANNPDLGKHLEKEWSKINDIQYKLNRGEEVKETETTDENGTTWRDESFEERAERMKEQIRKEEEAQNSINPATHIYEID